MNRVLVAVAVAVFSLTSVNSFAAGKSPEEKCKAQAEKKKIAADKMDEYVKGCVEKHSKTKKADAPAKAAK